MLNTFGVFAVAGKVRDSRKGFNVCRKAWSTNITTATGVVNGCGIMFLQMLNTFGVFAMAL